MIDRMMRKAILKLKNESAFQGGGQVVIQFRFRAAGAIV